jgi:hypothetical protein
MFKSLKTAQSIIPSPRQERTGRGPGRGALRQLSTAHYSEIKATKEKHIKLISRPQDYLLSPALSSIPNGGEGVSVRALKPSLLSERPYDQIR